MKTLRWQMSGALVFACLLIPASAGAEMHESGNQPSIEQQEDKAASEDVQAPRDFEGKIVQMKEVEQDGSEETTTLVLLETDEKQQVAVDLGPTSGLSAIELSEGNEIEVRGDASRVGDHVLLVASQLKVGDQEIDIQHSAETKRAADAPLDDNPNEPPAAVDRPVAGDAPAAPPPAPADPSDIGEEEESEY